MSRMKKLLFAGMCLFMMISVFAAPSISPYGYLRWDMARDSQVSPKYNWALWAAEEASSKDDVFTMTANQSRLGINLDGGEMEGMSVSGKLEIDFYSFDGSENQAQPRMRHAFLNMKWDNGISVLAGQTWDTFALTLPKTINFSPLFGAGNIGFRRPQLRLTKVADAMKYEFALTRPGTAAYPTVDAGMDSGLPALQARVSYNTKPLTLALATLQGKQEQTDDSDLTSSALILELKTRFGAFSIAGKYFTGQNVAEYLAGIAQDSSGNSGIKEIETTGGFVSAGYAFSPEADVNFGYGLDDPDNDTLPAAGARSKNSVLFINYFRKLGGGITTGVEFSQWTTKYFKGAGVAESKGENTRIQTMLTYAF